MDAYKKAWPYSDMDYLKQQRDDYCFWENVIPLKSYSHIIIWIFLIEGEIIRDGLIGFLMMSQVIMR